MKTPQITWYTANSSTDRELIAAWEGVCATDDEIEDVLEDFKVMTGCKHAASLGQTVDDLGRYQHLFKIAPSDRYSFDDARFDTRYRGEFAWAKEVCFFSGW